ncbi:efflux transporter periplasmic adaptor subunit [Deltaproteobacteria bacterium Smac51]|nr:efflux transporter periplasmic adaptor subunit [Deltaproteobacteria bacterium Smac51]
MLQKISGLLLLLVILSACGSDTPPPPPPVVVRTLTVELSNPDGVSVYSGAVRGRYESSLGFQVGGRISARHVDLGNFVKNGALLLEIDPKDLEENVRIAAAQVDSAKSKLNLASADFSRYDRLYKDGAVSKSQYDQYKTAFDAATESLHQAEAQHNQSLNALGYAKLSADADGVVSSLAAEVGQVVAAGHPVVTLVWSGELEVEITVPENRISALSLHQEVEVSFWALPDLTLKGFVREISPVADMATRTYAVRVSLSDPPDKVQLGMTASVKSSGQGGAMVAVVPTTAIFQSGEKAGVWLVKEGRVSLHPVTLGDFDENRAVVTEGLAGGDVLVTAGVHKLHEGQEVRVAGPEE